MAFSKTAISKAVQVFHEDFDTDEEAMEKAFLAYLEETNTRIIRNSRLRTLERKIDQRSV